MQTCLGNHQAKKPFRSDFLCNRSISSRTAKYGVSLMLTIRTPWLNVRHKRKSLRQSSSSLKGYLQTVNSLVGLRKSTTAYFAPSLYAAANPETTAISCMSVVQTGQTKNPCLPRRHTENSPRSSIVGVTLKYFSVRQENHC